MKRLSHLSLNLRFGLAFLLALLGQPAHALLTSCTVTPVSGPGALAYNPASTSDLTASFNLAVQCRALLTIGDYNITISFDGGNSGNPAARYAASGGNQLNYNLFQQGGAVAGNSGGGIITATLSLLLSFNTYNIPLSVVIPKNQYVPAGVYTDTIVVTVNYN